MNTMKWLLKREQWEHRGGFFWAPIVVAAILALLAIGSMLFGVLAGGDGKGIFHAGNNDHVSLQYALSSISEADKLEFAQGLAGAYPAIAVPVMAVLGFVVFFYALGCLFDERKDRSILFWKSLPVSDRDTVISKALTALVVGPLIALAVSLALSLLVLFTLMLLATAHGFNLFGAVLGDADFYLVTVQLISYLPIYALWALPTVGYLMFVSSWAKTKPFLWAVGVPVLGGVILSWINLLFGSPYDLDHYWRLVGRGLLSAFPGSWLPSVGDGGAVNAEQVMGAMLSNTYGLLAGANLWIGVGVGLAFLAGAVKMRRYRDEG